MLLREKALRGDLRALERIFELAVRFNNDMPEAGPAEPLYADDKAILAAYVAEISTAAAGSTEGDPLEDRPPQKSPRSKGRQSK